MQKIILIQSKLKFHGWPILGVPLRCAQQISPIRILMIVLIINLGLIGIFVPHICHATTYYVNGSAANDAGTGSESSPKKYIASGLGLMRGGDILIIEDGIYSGLNNMIGDSLSPQLYPPSGSPSAFTTIKARNIGQVIIDGEYLRKPFGMVGVTGRNYLHIDGIHFKRGNAGVFNIRGSYNKVTNCGFEDGQAPDSEEELEIAQVTGGSTYTLVEDCWVWGKGRYGFYTSSSNDGANHVVFRRIVVRFDDSPDGRATDGMRFYNADTCSAQNMIVLDANLSATAYSPAAFSTGGGSSISGEPNHSFYGNIAINNPLMAGYHFEKSSTTYPVFNSVLWDGLIGIQGSSSNLQNFTINASNITTGNHSQAEFYRLSSYTLMYMTIANSLLYVPNGGTAYVYPTSLSKSEHCLAPGANAGQATGSTAITQSALNAKLKYLPRTESGTNGATILYQTGVSGTFYGETGWNTTTTTPLWPFPNEALWAAKMKAYTASGPGGNRGFAALSGSTATPLTDYIWGYLGNPKPANIYATSAAPAAPQKLIVTPVSTPSTN